MHPHARHKYCPQVLQAKFSLTLAGQQLASISSRVISCRYYKLYPSGRADPCRCCLRHSRHQVQYLPQIPVELAESIIE